MSNDDDYVFHWTRRMSFDDKTAVLTMRLTETTEFDFWTNRMFIESLRELADDLEKECNNNELCESVDH